MCAAIPAILTRGPKGAPLAGAMPRCCPISKRAKGLAPSADIVIDEAAHNTKGPLGVSARDPILPAARQFVEAAVAAGIPKGDYNGRDRGAPDGVASLTQFTTRDGRRSSTYQAFLAGEPEQRPNLTIITGAQATRVLLDAAADDQPDGQPGGLMVATGVEYRTTAGETVRVHAVKEVILSAGASGWPSGRRPAAAWARHRSPMRWSSARPGWAICTATTPRSFAS